MRFDCLSHCLHSPLVFLHLESKLGLALSNLAFVPREIDASPNVHDQPVYFPSSPNNYFERKHSNNFTQQKIPRDDHCISTIENNHKNLSDPLLIILIR